MAIFRSQKEFSRRGYRKQFLKEVIGVLLVIGIVYFLRIGFSFHIAMIIFPAIFIPIQFLQDRNKIYVEEINIDEDRKLVTLHYFQYSKEHGIIQRSFNDLQIDILGRTGTWFPSPLEIYLLGMLPQEVKITAKKDGFTKQDIATMVNLLLDLTSPVKRRSL